jgi:hypothetical protein
MDFPDSCTIEQMVSEDGYHDKTYSTPKNIKCRYTEVTEIKEDGSSSVTSAWVAFPPGTTINKNCRVTLESGKQPPIMLLETVKSPVTRKIEYLRVILGSPLNRGEI